MFHVDHTLASAGSAFHRVRDATTGNVSKSERGAGARAREGSTCSRGERREPQERSDPRARKSGASELLEVAVEFPLGDLDEVLLELLALGLDELL